MRLNYNSEIRQSLRLGHGHAFINQIRQNNNDKYCYIKALSQTPYFEDGYHRYRIIREEVYDKFMELLNTLIDNRLVSAFEKDIECKPYRMQHMGIRIKRVKNVTWKLLREMELLIPQIEAFMERRTRLHPEPEAFGGKTPFKERGMYL